jgi:hypothetical protein
LPRQKVLFWHSLNQGLPGSTVRRGGGVLATFIDSFRRNADGSWTCVASVTFLSRGGPIRFTEGATFPSGMMFMGIRVSKLLDEMAKYSPPTSNPSEDE